MDQTQSNITKASLTLKNVSSDLQSNNTRALSLIYVTVSLKSIGFDKMFADKFSHSNQQSVIQDLTQMKFINKVALHQLTACNIVS